MTRLHPLRGRGRAALLVTCALLLGAAGCGSDDEEAGTDSQPPAASPVETPPATGVPEPEPEDADPSDEPEPPVPLPEPPAGGSGGVSPEPEPEPEPEPGGGGASGGVSPGQPDPPGSDSAGNDVEPEPGTPEDQFESFCDANPNACG